MKNLISYISWKKLQQYSCVLFADCGSNHPSSSSEQLTQSIHGQTRPRRPRRPWTRAVFSNLQRKGLEKRFQVQKYLTKADRHQLASMLGLSDNQVKVWFQNRRMKWRQEARESVTSTNTEAEDEKSWQRWPSFWSCAEGKKSVEIYAENSDKLSAWSMYGVFPGLLDQCISVTSLRPRDPKPNDRAEY